MQRDCTKISGNIPGLRAWVNQCCRSVDFTPCSVEFYMSLVTKRGLNVFVDFVDFSVDDKNYLWTYKVHKLFDGHLIHIKGL